MGESLDKPRWIRDLIRFSPLKSQFVLTGNVKDFQISATSSGHCRWNTLEEFLARELNALNYSAVIIFDPVNGFSFSPVVEHSQQKLEDITHNLGIRPDSEGTPSLADFGSTLERIAFSEGEPIALIANFSSQLIIQPDGLSRNEHDAFTRALIASQRVKPKPFGSPVKSYFNSIIWIVDKEGDLPDWMVVDNPRVRTIPLSKPDNNARQPFAESLLKSLKDYRDTKEQDRRTALKTFVEQTDGFLLMDLYAVIELARAENLSCKDIGDAIRRYKVGVTEDPWKQINKQNIKEGETFITKRVKGQSHAVTHLLDIVKRAITGVGSNKRGGRPRGVAFLAGPTGVGKTELAKTVTSLLFGDENAYIRFDMSEFSAEHSDQRLIGAPPGYVGYDAGGELTNAVRERPFSVILFDEIEKAHPKILDKFLQVLDDGVLTSGRGEKVYFSETFIIFTSNLGIYKQNNDGDRVPNVSQQTPYPEVKKCVRQEIDNHFKLILNRPEILNRIGENIIVFDFIRKEVAKEIFEAMLTSILTALMKDQNITVTLSKRAKSDLEEVCLEDLSNGGRGIRNMIEAYLVNPLSRALFDQNAAENDHFNISRISLTETIAEVVIEKSDKNTLAGCQK